MSTYRWNTTEATRAYDAAAPVIHPFYDDVQGRILELLVDEVKEGEPFLLVDIGGGSGRLLEKLLDRFALARGRSSISRRRFWRSRPSGFRDSAGGLSWWRSDCRTIGRPNCRQHRGRS